MIHECHSCLATSYLFLDSPDIELPVDKESFLTKMRYEPRRHGDPVYGRLRLHVCMYAWMVAGVIDEKQKGERELNIDPRRN